MIYANTLEHSLLDKAEERALLTQAQSGDDNARERLILCNMRLVASIATTLVRKHECVDEDDVMGDGVIGLCHAIEKFDLGKPFRFSTFATWQIYSAIAKSSFFNEHVRLPAYVREDIRAITLARADLLRETGIEPTNDKLIERTGMTVEKINALDDIRAASNNVLSLYQSVGSDENDRRTLMDLIPSAEHADFMDFEIADELEFFLAKLQPVERLVVELRHGIHPEHYCERVNWKDIYRKLHGDGRKADNKRKQLHWNDLPTFYDNVMTRLKALGTAVKEGKPLPDMTAVREAMTPAMAGAQVEMLFE